MVSPPPSAPPLPPEPCASGSSLLAVRNALERLVGADIVSQTLTSLPREVRDEFDTMTPLSWVRMTTSSRVIDAVAARAGWAPEALYDAAVRKGVEQSFRTWWKVLLHFTTDEALLARAPLIYSKARNVGALIATSPSPGRAELRVVGWPNMSDRAVRSVGISLQATLELVGRRHVRGSWSRTHDGALYQLRWQPSGLRASGREREPASADRGGDLLALR